MAADSNARVASGFRRFALALAAFAVMPPCLLAAFVVAVDPYYVFGSPSWAGFNKVRPYYEFQVVAAKPYQVARIKPDAVTLGSSRVEVGLDPRHAGWGGSTVFNFGMPSASSYEVMLALLHAQSVGGPSKRVVVGLDFFAYNIFFARSQQVLEARFSGDGVDQFAAFLDTELAARRRDKDAVDREPVRTKVPKEPVEAIPPDMESWDEATYLAVNADVVAAIGRKEFQSGREHFELAGRAEHRTGGLVPANWDEALYLRMYPDVAAEVRKGTFRSGYHHYLAAGRAEGRRSAPPNDWDEALYLRLHSDVAAEVRRGTFLSGYHHYLAAGRAERRETGILPKDWSEALYLKINPDVAREVARGTFLSGYHHYLLAGRSERREGGFIPGDWDEATYLQVNRDVEYHITQGLFLNGYHHYLAAGRAEKRLGGHREAGWNEAQYLAANPAARIRLAFGDYRSGYAHYLAAGRSQEALGPTPDILPQTWRPGWQWLDKEIFKLGEWFRFVFSTTALYDSIATIVRQPELAEFNDRGMRIWENHDNEMRQDGGNGYVFRAHLLSWRWYLWLRPPRYMYCFSNVETGMSTFDPYRFMLRRAYAEGTDMRLYMTPLHVAVRTLLDALGLGDRYEYWQREVVRINDEEAARARRQPFPLWDFSDANSITREVIPAPADMTPLTWYWEHSHYRKATGDLILDRILAHDYPARAVPADFGVRLTGEDIVAHQAQSRARITDWSAANAEFAAQIVAATRVPNAQNRQREATCW